MIIFGIDPGVNGAISILEKAKRQDSMNNQMNMMNSLEHKNTMV